MSAKLVLNLLKFMYNGSVNVKQEDLQDFMKIAETLKIKGLTNCSKEAYEIASKVPEDSFKEKTG